MPRATQAGRGAGGHPLGDERAGQRSQRRHEALGKDEHVRALRHGWTMGGDRDRQRAGGHGEADEVLRREPQVGRPRDRDALGQTLRRAGSGRSRERCASSSACSAVRQPSSTSRPARASTTARAVPHDPAPTMAARRSGGRPPSHSHWSITQGQIRSVTAPARWRDGDSTAGSAAAVRSARGPCAGGSASRGARARCRCTATGTTGAPVSSASRPTPRLGVPSDPGRTRVPSGKMRTQSPRPRMSRAVRIDSWSPAPRSTGNAPSAFRTQACQRVANSSFLAT